VPLTELTRDRRTQLPVTYEPDAARVAISYPARPPHLLEIGIPCLKRIFAIACGYEDGDDLDRLRGDLVFKLAYGRLPDTGPIYARSRPSRAGENAPSLSRSRPGCIAPFAAR
jgi:hypothetical protein